MEFLFGVVVGIFLGTTYPFLWAMIVKGFKTVKAMLVKQDM